MLSNISQKLTPHIKRAVTAIIFYIKTELFKRQNLIKIRIKTHHLKRKSEGAYAWNLLAVWCDILSFDTDIECYFRKYM